MKRKTFKLGEDTVTLPPGTRVLLKADLPGDDGFNAIGLSRFRRNARRKTQHLPTRHHKEELDERIATLKTKS